MREPVFRIAGLLLGFVALACGALAAAPYPARPVRVVAPFAPGGGTDIVARVLAQQFAEQLGKSFIVDNRPGASGMIAYDIVAKAAADGHTLLITNSAFASLPGLMKSLPYDPMKSFTPVSEILRAPNVLVVHPSTNVNTVKDFIAAARAKGKLPGRQPLDMSKVHAAIKLVEASISPTEAARQLGIGRSTIYREMRRLGVERPI